MLLPPVKLCRLRQHQISGKSMADLKQGRPIQNQIPEASFHAALESTCEGKGASREASSLKTATASRISTETASKAPYFVAGLERAVG